ncbi:pseudouridine synthase [Chloroflexota bacterium]
MTSQTILKLLTGSGIGSRRKMADAIKQGRVEVNGTIVEDFRQAVNARTDRVTIDGNPVGFKRESPVYVILNKPKGITATTNDDRGNETVMDILPKKYQNTRLYPVGRLDKESTGLILLTNDGELTYRLTHPKFEREKEYLVQIEGSLMTEEIMKLKKGLELDDGKTYPAVVREAKSPPFNYSITIHEGRKRQVRRMFASLEHRVLELRRVRMGGIRLGDLKEGDTRELSGAEIRALAKG